MLEQAGVSFEVDPPRVDEDAVKHGLRAEGLAPRDMADALAQVKALSVSNRRPEFVLGGDQMLDIDGQVLDKPKDMDEARAHLKLLRGREHKLVTAAVIARAGAPVWRHVEVPRLRMRAFSDAFLEQYLVEAGAGILSSVGAYQLEGLGAQLFERVEGDYFSVLGLPLLPLMAFLREHGLTGR
jgi:septum formation protein